MSPVKPEDYERYKGDHREQKLERRKRPRGRRIVGRKLQKDVEAKGKEERIEGAKEEIRKVLLRFENMEPPDAEKQVKIYIRWKKELLNKIGLMQ